MAKMETFRVLVPSYINEALREPDEIVTINTDLKDGGMRPGKGLEKVKPGTVSSSFDPAASTES